MADETRGSNGNQEIMKSHNTRIRLLFGAILFLIYAIVMLLISSPGMPPTGDEPHYLITAHSLVVDGDLDLLNNYKDKDYRIFYPGVLAKRTTRAPDPTLELPAFSPGLAFLLAPFYKIALVLFPGFLVPFLRLIICFIAAVAVCQLLKLADQFETDAPLLVLAGAALASPLITYSSQFYPEIVAFLFLVLALVQFQNIDSKPWKSLLWLSLLSPALIWLHPKYLILSLLVFSISCFFFNQLRKRHPEKKYGILQFLHLVISVGGIAAFFLWLHSFYGSWSPNRIYGGVQRETNLLELIESLGWERFRIMFRMIFGYWLDERFGLIPYAPIYALFFSSFIWAIRRFGARMIPATILFAGHFLLICWGAQMGGYSPPSRHMVVLLPIILLPLLLIYSQWNRKQKILFVILEILGWAVSAAIFSNYRKIFTDATWRNPDGGSVFWAWIGIESWIPNLTATNPNWLLVGVWIAAIVILSIMFYPFRAEPFSRR
jgi:hypothetical protein